MQKSISKSHDFFKIKKVSKKIEKNINPNRAHAHADFVGFEPILCKIYHFVYQEISIVSFMLWIEINEKKYLQSKILTLSLNLTYTVFYPIRPYGQIR
jgi:hypothetical protein